MGMHKDDSKHASTGATSMSKVSEAAERLLESYGKWTDAGGRTTCEDIRKVSNAYLRIIDKLKSHCNSATNPGDHGLAFEILVEMGER